MVVGTSVHQDSVESEHSVIGLKETVALVDTFAMSTRLYPIHNT